MRLPLRLRRAFGVVVTLVVTAGACGSGAKTPASPTGANSGTTNAAGTTAAASCRLTSTPGGGQGSGDVSVPGDIPDNQAYVAYVAAGAYTIDVPEGWARQGSGADVTFTNNFNSIRVDVVPATAAPTAASAQSTEVPSIGRTIPCFQAGAVSQVTRTAGRVVLATYRAASAPDPVTGKVVLNDVERYEFWRPGSEGVVTLSSPRGSDNVDPWRKVTDSFAWNP
jgi:hypothetical protein